MKKITFTNPVCPHGADPWVVKDEDKYYYCFSGEGGVRVTAASSPLGATYVGSSLVYTPPDGTAYSCEYWAPELHKINGKWYIYVAADDGNNENHRMYVLKCTTDCPTDKFEMVGKITDPTDKWAIDGTVLQYNGELFFVWSGWEGDENVSQNIYIARMSGPTEICSERVLLSRPEYDWEKLGCNNGLPTINEGPVALLKDETVHIIYSASGSWCEFYRLGKLTYRPEKGDIMDASAWVKSDIPVFKSSDDVFGTGHCSFTEDAAGNTVMVYHANLERHSGWEGRSVWVKPIEWSGDEPIFGMPSKTETIFVNE